MDNEKDPKDEEKSENQDLLNDYLKEINEVELKAAESFDKQVLGLSSGGLGLSITFLTKFAASEEALILLKFSWAFFILTILLTVLSYFIRVAALNWQVSKVEAYYLTTTIKYPDPKDNPFAKAMYILSWFVGIFFLFGVILTAVSIGVSNGKENCKKEVAQEVCQEVSKKEIEQKTSATPTQEEVNSNGK